MIDKDELFYLLLLQKVANLGDSSAKKLIRNAGSAKAVFNEKKSTLLKIDGIGEHRIKELQSKEYAILAEEEMAFIDKNKITAIAYQSESYPERLKQCIDAPILMFQRGNINLNNKKILSVVGSRNITTYGTAFCEKLIEELSPLNPIIVSGFAYGVDITAHKAAIKNGLQTIACLGHGLNQIYPKTHSKYVNEMENNGGFFTEFWSSDFFDKNNFLKRNRIIAGISEATIVIESAQKGGSLVTAQIANSYNREVFALPGKITDKMSEGCNNLIKTHRANMLTSAADIVYMLNWKLENEKPKVVQKQLFVELTEEEKKVYHFLKENPKEVLDIIAIKCELPVYKLTTILLNMELKGVIRPLPGKIYDLS